MRSSSTFREPVLRGFCSLLWALAMVGCICLVEQARALDAGRMVSQYVYDKWGAANGFTYGEIFAISQSSDGYLWIGTEQGLVRYDGTAFKLIAEPVPGEPALGSVFGLEQDANGSLWVRGNSPMLLRYRNGKFEDIFASDTEDEFTATSMQAAPGGGMLLWARGKHGYCYCGGKLTTTYEA